MPSSRRSRAWLRGLGLGLGAFGACGLCGVWPRSGAAETTPPAGLELSVEADKDAYTSGEPIALTLRVVNRGLRTVRLPFRDAQRYDIVVQDPGGRPVWRWSTARMFAQVWGEETLEADGGAMTYRVTVTERFPPGRYTITALIPTAQAPLSARLDLTIR